MSIAAPSSGSVRPIESRSLSEQVTNEIRRSILAGTLPPGQSLSLRRLAEQLDVSFIPVRDALRVLESEGLVVNPPGRSATVAPLDLDEFHAIYRVRRLLEPDLARRSVRQLEDAELDRLYQAAAEFGGAERSMDDIYDDHRAFHLALLAPAASACSTRTRPSTTGGARRTSCWSTSSASATPRSPPAPSTSTWPTTRTSPTAPCSAPRPGNDRSSTGPATISSISCSIRPSIGATKAASAAPLLPDSAR